MDYTNTTTFNNLQSHNTEMIGFGRSGQGQQDGNTQYNYYSGNQTGQQRNAGGYDARSSYKFNQASDTQFTNPDNYQNSSLLGSNQYGREFYKSQNQQGNEMQLEKSDDYEKSSDYSSSQYGASQNSLNQYMDNTNQRSGMQYKPQASWKDQQYGQEQGLYQTGGNVATSFSSMKNLNNKGYQQSSNWEASDCLDEPTPSFQDMNKDFQMRGREASFGLGFSSGRGRGFYNSGGNLNTSMTGAYNTYQGRENTRGVRPMRGGYQKMENIKKNQSFNSEHSNNVIKMYQGQNTRTLSKKPLIKVPPSTSNANKMTVPFQKPAPWRSLSSASREVKNEKKRFPFRVSDGGIHKEKKTTEINLKFRKYVQPKNAMVCLSELVPGLVYNAEEDDSKTNSPFCFSVEVNGQKYRGYGSSKQMAKQAAAEAALISFVKPPDTQAKEEDDTTPWTVLVPFAVYKLLNDWRGGRVGVGQPGSTGVAPSSATPEKPDPNTLQTVQPTPCSGADVNKAEVSKVLSTYLEGHKNDPKKPQKPAKQVPENAATMHPVMLLNQLRPQVSYSHTSVMKDNHQVFTITSTIDEREFSGQGSSLKKAKFELAVKAVNNLFNIESTYQLTTK